MSLVIIVRVVLNGLIHSVVMVLDILGHLLLPGPAERIDVVVVVLVSARRSVLLLDLFNLGRESRVKSVDASLPDVVLMLDQVVINIEGLLDLLGSILFFLFFFGA